MTTNYETQLHADGTVTLWDVQQQRWQRHFSTPRAEVLATLGSDRQRVVDHFERHDPTADRVARCLAEHGRRI